MLFEDLTHQEMFADNFKGWIVNTMYMVLAALHYIPKLFKNHAYRRINVVSNSKFPVNFLVSCKFS